MPFWGIPEDVMREALEESFKSPVVRKAFVENLAKSPGAITGVKTTKSGNNSTTKKKRTSTRSKSSTQRISSKTSTKKSKLDDQSLDFLENLAKEIQKNKELKKKIAVTPTMKENFEHIKKILGRSITNAILDNTWNDDSLLNRIQPILKENPNILYDIASTETRASVLETTTTEKSSRGIGSTSTSGTGR